MTRRPARRVAVGFLGVGLAVATVWFLTRPDPPPDHLWIRTAPPTVAGGWLAYDEPGGRVVGRLDLCRASPGSVNLEGLDLVLEPSWWSRWLERLRLASPRSAVVGCYEQDEEARTLGRDDGWVGFDLECVHVRGDAVKSR